MGMKGVMNLTPAMRQYLEIKEQYKDCILFFRMGDFYEMFFEDAVTASRILDIALTSRNKGKEDSIPLCGVPYHAASSYIAKLVEHGFKVAICEQVEDPRFAKGIVKREVVRIITPGLFVDGEALNARESSFLAAISSREETFGLAFIDISTGEFRITESQDREFFSAEISGLDFREILVSEDARQRVAKVLSHTDSRIMVTFVPPDFFDYETAIVNLKEYFQEAGECDQSILSRRAAVSAAGAILRYVEETQKEHLGHINTVQWYETDAFLVVDGAAKRNLELFSTITDNRKEGSLFHVIDLTVTSMGSRKLRWWLSYPLVNLEEITQRLCAVSEIKDRHLQRESLREVLRGVYDLERLSSRIAMGMANARDLVALKNSLKRVPDIKSLIGEFSSDLITSLSLSLDDLQDVRELIERAIVDDPPLTIREGGIIKEGYDSELDELITISRDGKKWIAALEEKERKRTGINSLKVGFNTIFGYYIEVSKLNTHLVPDDYIRKQTLVNAERYINQELKEYEFTVLTAEDRRKAREYALFSGIRDRIAAEIKRIQRTASCIATIDALAALAEVAERYNYCCPVVDEEDIIEIKDGRHAIVERMPLLEGFVPNDLYMDLEEHRFLIITGPNMAGKSTYIRQVALIVILAQMGSFVPASKARIGLVDRVFTRVGASDVLAKGQSTFMVEMTEVASILKNATKRSLIILDEVGRGTSTFDGLSIAWATAEYIHDEKHIGARTLFATHYHQLTELALTKRGVKNYNVAVKEWGDRIIFLRKIMEGGTNRSYGIQVARIAGVPEEVLSRAEEILKNLERGEFDEAGMPKIARGKRSTPKDRYQLSLFTPGEDIVIQEVKEIDVLNMTPMQALQKILSWKERLCG